MFGIKRKHDHAQTNLLRANGVPACGTFNYDGKKTNPCYNLNRDKSKYEVLLSNYDLNQCVARYIWEDLPDDIKSYDVERMLYYRTGLTGFKRAGKHFILPFIIQGSLTPYGYPNEIKPISFNGKPLGDKNDVIDKNLVLKPNTSGQTDYDCVLLFDSVPRFTGNNQGMSRFALNQILISDMADVLSRVNINVVVTNKKLFLIAKDPNQRDIIESEVQKAFGSDSPIVTLSSELDIQTVQNTSDYQADDLFNVMKNYDSLRCFMSGIQSKNYGTEKKERLVSGELAGNEEQIDLIADMGLELRKDFANKMNELFGLHIKVRKRADDYDEETNGRNLTQDEEQELLD